MTLLNQLVRDMNRKIERQKERAILESSARPLTAEDKARLDAIKARHCLALNTLHEDLSEVLEDYKVCTMLPRTASFCLARCCLLLCVNVARSSWLNARDIASCRFGKHVKPLGSLVYTVPFLYNCLLRHAVQPATDS